MRDAAAQAGLELEIDSCGTAAYHIGDPPDPRAVEIAKRHGVDISTLRGRQLSRDDFRRFDHIFALDGENLKNIRAVEPDDGTAKVSLLLDVVEDREGEPVADPYYGDLEGFEDTWADVSAAAEALVERFREKA